MLKMVRPVCFFLGIILVTGAKAGMAYSSSGRTANELAHPLGWEDDAGQDHQETSKKPADPEASANTFSALAKGVLPETTPPEDDVLTGEIQELIHHLGGEPHQRQRAIERLVMIGLPAVKPLQAALADDYKFTRIGALSALGYLRSRDVLGDVEKLLQDPEYEVRAEALMTLGKMKAQSETPAIIAGLSDKHPRVRRAAVVALGRMKSAEACDALIASLADPAADVRRQAAQELSPFAESRVVAALLRSTLDADAETSAYAARSLGEIGDPAAKPRLRDLLSSRSRFVREEAAAALKNFDENERK